MKPNKILSYCIEQSIINELDVIPDKLVVHDVVNNSESLILSVEICFKGKYYFKNFKIDC